MFFTQHTNDLIIREALIKRAIKHTLSISSLTFVYLVALFSRFYDFYDGLSTKQ